MDPYTNLYYFHKTFPKTFILLMVGHLLVDGSISLSGTFKK